MDTIHGAAAQQFTPRSTTRFGRQNSREFSNVNSGTSQRQPIFNIALLQLLLKLIQGLRAREQPVSERSAPEQPIVEEPVSEQPTSEQPVFEQPTVEPQPTTPEKPLVEQPASQQPTPEKPVVEQPVSEQPTVEQPILEQPATELQPPKETHSTINLSSLNQDIISGLFSQATGVEASVEDENKDNRLNVNDAVVFRDKQNAIISTHTLTENDIYDIKFRENMVKLAKGLPHDGWAFNESGFVKIEGRLNYPETRLYSDNNRRFSYETVIERNNYWETVIRDGDRMLVQREFDDSGKKVISSDALKHIMNNSHDYSFDCSTPMPILALVATMNVIGEDDFNARVSPVNLSGWFDKYDQSQSDGGFRILSREASAGEITVNNTQNLEGEKALFDTSKGDKLIPGGGYYFDLPGDDKSSYQGWNAVYLGKSNDGGHLFWTADIGTQNIHFKENSWIPSNSRFKNHYLSAYVANTDTDRLVNWDRDRSAAA